MDRGSRSKENAPRVQINSSHVVVIEGLPTVTPDKVEKLKQKLALELGKAKVESIYFPTGEDGKTLSFGYAEMKDAESARKVPSVLSISKKYKQRVRLLADLDTKQYSTDYSNVLVVDGCPNVDDKKYGRLCKKIRSVYGKFGKVINVFFPRDEKGVSTLGDSYGFVEFERSFGTPEAAAEALKDIPLDKKHVLKANLLTDFDEMEAGRLKYEPPQKAQSSKKALNFNKWIEDEFGRDQYAVRRDEETEIMWYDPMRMKNKNGQEVAYVKDQKWTEDLLHWSPHGSFLATFHRQGIALWGGTNFEKIGRFPHKFPRLIDFSPNESYLVTLSPTTNNIILWDVKTGAQKEQFVAPTENRKWPVFKWSPDEKYLARLNKDSSTGERVISVYETPAISLLDNRSIPVADVNDIQWSPTDNILSYCVPEKGNRPAYVALLNMPSKKQFRKKHLYNVEDIKMHWQSNGDYLCVKMLKKGKNPPTNFEIFRIRAKNVPVESLEIKEEIIAFKWEPSGHRFAIIHGERHRPNVSIYRLATRKMKLVRTLEGRECNSLFWSPNGRYIILANIETADNRSPSGRLDFVDTDTFDTLAEVEHFRCNFVEWNPSGLGVITAMTQPVEIDPRYSSNNGYRCYSEGGELLTTVNVDKLFQVLWRPRPKVLLTKAREEEIKRELKEKKEMWRRWEAEEERIRLSTLGEWEQNRQRLKEEFKRWKSSAEKVRAAQKEARRALRDGQLSDEESEVEIEEEVEVELSFEEIRL